ncbi:MULTISPECIES: dihydrofolate reductase [Vagococcus]|uniref:Dihydrofolate reductase n=1 Tax=Vagococcus fluvialis bH819 TaxID=1255619 RepID=A0A1X6WN68_9ENTE|nr:MULTISPECIES: dihydrofolate reductase [Vagococcus]SLM85709.1 Dihydrofolate reductase [Vagococcus fluvialis bH819]HCM90131.1 dihydrofolate reductase [Vagococcus sp.]
MIAAIWAQDENGLIGKEEVLPWHLPNDLQFFKQMTENNVIVMGRKTFEGMGKHLLPNRQTIVLTSDQNYDANGALVMHSVEEVLAFSNEFEGITFITGGGEIYKNFLPHIDVLYRTLIKAKFEGDTYFPYLDWEEWNIVSTSEGEVDDKNIYPHDFETYQRNA